MDINQYRRAFRKKVIPSYYNGKLHVSLFALLQLGATTYWIRKVENWSLWSIPLILASVLWATWILYFTHRYVLHQKIYGFHWAYKMHHWHHTFYQAKQLEYDESNDLYMLFMPPWLQAFYFFIYLPILFFLLSYILPLWILTHVICVLVMWYGAYELIHWISHLPDTHWIMQMNWAKWMKGHHRNHHHPVYKDQCNFGIVEPSMDYLFKTKR